MAVLFDFVNNLDCPYFFERSIKLSHGVINAGRYLLSFPYYAVEQQGGDHLSDFLLSENFPEQCLDDVSRDLKHSGMCHLGVDPGEEESLYKLYIEYPLVEDGLRRLLHRAYKWQPIPAGGSVVTEYYLLPPMNQDSIVANITSTLSSKSIQTACVELIEQACSRYPAEDIMCLEVTEASNDRKSMDINLYDAELTVLAVTPAVSRIAEELQVNTGEFNRFITDIAELPFGHVAYGIDRHDDEYVTFYYGVIEMTQSPEKNQLVFNECMQYA